MTVVFQKSFTLLLNTGLLRGLTLIARSMGKTRLPFARSASIAEDPRALKKVFSLLDDLLWHFVVPLWLDLGTAREATMRAQRCLLFNAFSQVAYVGLYIFI